MQSICIRVATEYRLFHAISAREGKRITSSELAKETGADELLISESA